MSAHVLQPAILATLMLLGVLAAGPADAADPTPAKSILGKAQSSAERENLESLLGRLEAGQRPARPRNVDEAAKAEELARQLAREPRSAQGASNRHETVSIPPAADAAPKGPGTVTTNSFTFPKALGGQPIGRAPAEPRSPEVNPAPVVAASPPPTPTLPPVAPGIHLSPGAIPASHPIEKPPVRSEPAAPRARVPELPPLPPPAPAAREASLPAVDAPTSRPAAHGKKTPPPVAARRALCTDILQRATLGELTEEDRAILRTQCR